MIIPLGGLLLGAALGAALAWQRGGKPADLAQWAAVTGMIGGILGLFVLVAIQRTMV